MNDYTVYAHIAPNGKSYIGITRRTPQVRWGPDGLGYYDKKSDKRTPFVNAIEKYGWDNFQHIILLENLSKEVACECERYLIAKYDTTNRCKGYNICRGGEANEGYRHTEETRKQLSIMNTGKIIPQETRDKLHNTLLGRPNTWQKGKKISNETRLKRSKALSGHEVKEETRAKIRKANTGKKHSVESRLKMSEHNCMKRQEIRDKVSKSLRQSGKERANKRKETMSLRYPEGFKQSDESNKKRSESMKGIPKSEETRRKMKKPKSPEAIENMRKAQLLSYEARRCGMTYKEYKAQIGGR